MPIEKVRIRVGIGPIVYQALRAIYVPSAVNSCLLINYIHVCLSHSTIYSTFYLYLKEISALAE